MAVNAATHRRAQSKTATAVQCALYSNKNHALAATAVLVLATATMANHQEIALQLLNRQTLESILSSWKTPCFVYSRWWDCSLLFRDYLIANSNRKALPELQKLVNYRVKPSPRVLNLGHTMCTNSDMCAATAPMRVRNGFTSLSSLRPFYDEILQDVPLSSADTLPQKDANDPLLSSNRNNPEEDIVPPTVSTTVTSCTPKTTALTADENEYIMGTTSANDSLEASMTSIPGAQEDEATPPIDSSMRITNELEQNSSIQTGSPGISDVSPSVNSNFHKASTENGLHESSKVYKVVLLSLTDGPSTAAPIIKNGDILNGPFSETVTPKWVEYLTTPRSLSKSEATFELFKESLDRLERKFLLSTFTKLTAISPAERRVNGISFLQSGLFLHLLLTSLSTEVDQTTVREIEDCIGLYVPNEVKIEMLRQIVSSLPEPSAGLKFRWSSRLVLGRSLNASSLFRGRAATAMNLTLSQLDTNDPAAMTKTLNDMVDSDSGGTMRDTFEEEELVRGACGVALATLYVRARWRAAPTLLNGTRPFRDADAHRATRFFRVNDRVRYAYLRDWDAEAIEIPYGTPGLSLLVVVPKEPVLGALVARVARAGVAPLLAAARPLRAAVTLPLYTLRMTLLLPNKLHHMGMSSLVDVNNTDCGSLRLSHAVQRLMFWAEAGRNAYKDDGIEWDPRPDVEVLVDRPYLFFVRWHNLTLMNGNFVL